jgi:tetratricopeptide (TPR) repeat protein
MTRSRGYFRLSWTVSLVALLTAAFHPGAAEAADPVSVPVRAAMVDADAPATYRLPLVANRVPPADRMALRADAVRQSAPIGANSPSSAELTSQLLPAVQRGHNLAQRGALFAARTEFIQVLRRVAQAKDAEDDSDNYSQALAAGLRALDEAEDFVPAGVQLEAELNVQAVASSHRTPVLHDCTEEVLPHEAADMYHVFAQQKLATAAASQQAGSMALYGLGKVYARRAERRDDDVSLVRSAMTMYAASLGARPDNHLAANELGVLLCRTGHPAEAVDQFKRSIDRAPSATTYHNLAVAQQKLGKAGEAAANEQESQRLAAWERSTGAVSRRAGVQWVSPAELARASQSEPLTPAALNATNAQQPQNPRTASRFLQAMPSQIFQR